MFPKAFNANIYFIIKDHIIGKYVLVNQSKDAK